MLLARLGQVGKGSAVAGRKRNWQRREERRMKLQRKADLLAGLELVPEGECLVLVKSL